MSTQRTARNLWHNPQSAYSKQAFTYPGKCLFTHRGVEVFKNPAGSFDYLCGDAAITQRAGFGKDAAAEIIDEILDGKTPVAPAVAAHLTAQGFSPVTYSQYHADVLAGSRS